MRMNDGCCDPGHESGSPGGQPGPTTESPSPRRWAGTTRTGTALAITLTCRFFEMSFMACWFTSRRFSSFRVFFGAHVPSVCPGCELLSVSVCWCPSLAAGAVTHLATQPAAFYRLRRPSIRARITTISRMITTETIRIFHGLKSWSPYIMRRCSHTPPSFRAVPDQFWPDSTPSVSGKSDGSVAWPALSLMRFSVRGRPPLSALAAGHSYSVGYSSRCLTVSLGTGLSCLR